MDRRVLNPLPDAPGAYALILRLARETRLDIRTLGRPVLPAGLYLYAGSARGPGGIRAPSPGICGGTRRRCGTSTA
ncbi:MAG: hypothetical protein OXC28_05300 [Defluviicoccus sp.]|nr:hypothetical protein [Defluviicoccus sp.]